MPAIDSMTRTFALLLPLLGAPAGSWAAGERVQSASDNLARDAHGVYAADLAFSGPPTGMADWFGDDDWADYGSYFTDNLRSGYGGPYGRFDWGEARWRFSGWSDEGPSARDITWRSDRFGVFEDGYAWSSSTIGLDDWSAASTRDWAGYDESGDPAWFGF